MSEKLSNWAKNNNVKYGTAYSWVQSGKIKGYTNEGGGIMVGEKTNTSVATIAQSNFNNKVMEPLAAGYETNKLTRINLSEANTKTRTNRSAVINPFDRFANINNIFIPFRYSDSINNTSGLSIKDVLTLAIKAYYGYPIIRNTTDVTASFCASKIYLTGGSKKSRDFFTAYFKSIKLDSFCKQFFKEFWKTSNCFIYRHLGALKDSDIKEIQKSFGLHSVAKKAKIPVKYSMLNPVDIEVQESVTYFNPVYRKLLSEYELGRLRNPQNDQDKEVFNSLPKESQDAIKSKRTTAVYINLDSTIIKAIYNGKADYENFAVPVTYGLLDTLEAKTQLLKMDLSVAKTCQHAVLLITHGYEGKDGSYNYNQKVTEVLQTIFTNESVGRVLVTDFSVKGEFLIPNIGQLLDPKKYEVIQRDLEEGLGHLLFGGGGGGEKFANQHSKVKIFVEKLRSAREVFLDEFLVDEIKYICDELGFRDYPTPHFEDIDLEDSNEYKRIVTQLAQFGFLTPEETFEAIETHKLPTKEDSLENQKEYRELRDKGYYEPILGGPETQKELAKIGAENKKQEMKQNGRPPGSKAPQTTKKVSPIGTGGLDENMYSLAKIRENTLAAAQLEESINSQLKKKFKIKELNEKQKEVLGGIVNLIMTDHEPSNWLSKSKEYVENPISQNPARQNELLDITFQHQVSDFIGAILLHSKNVTTQ